MDFSTINIESAVPETESTNTFTDVPSRESSLTVTLISTDGAFDGEFKIINSKIVGSNHLKMELRLDGHDKSIEAIAFNTTDKEWPTSTERVQTVYKLDINEYAGRRRLQLVLDYIDPL